MWFKDVSLTTKITVCDLESMLEWNFYQIFLIAIILKFFHSILKSIIKFRTDNRERIEDVSTHSAQCFKPI